MQVRHFVANPGRRALAAAAGLVLALAGCQGPDAFARKDAKANPGPGTGDGVVIRAGQIQEAPAKAFKGAADLAAAEELFHQSDYRRAEKLFAKVADDTSNPPLQAEKARYFEAECERLRGDLTGAMGTYNRMLKDFQYGVFRERAVGKMFEIANFWLDDTRAQLDAEAERAAGKRFFVPWNFVHFDRKKPTFDEEGHALKAMEQVYYNDPTGPYAERALFMAGYVHFRRGNFREADQLLSQAVETIDRNNKKSELRDQAVELAILAKNNSTGGPSYDGRKAAESLKMIQQARMTSPETAANHGEFLDKQTKIIRFMQAEKDYDIAEFYRRTGHPASAWFYYELVRRRYQETEFHGKAIARMKEINTDLTEQQQQSEFARAARREWNKWALGHETPTLRDGQTVPAVPGEMPERRDDQVIPVGGRMNTPPADIAPRR
jgi:outer membrane protein assembly factor BamD (BamD/ComL family)